MSGKNMENNDKTSASEYILTSTSNGVMTLTMNRPKRLNGWTQGMMAALKTAFVRASKDDETKVLILTGTGRYYSAGVNLGGTLKMSHPRTLHKMIVKHNQELFEDFLDFPKPILVAMNGSAIGATVTSATLCDGIIASESATLSTPFAQLGIPPEGCSSIHLARLMGEDNAKRMLEQEGWKPTAAEALEVGLVQWVVKPDELLHEAQRIAEGWIADGATRSFRGGSTREELKAVNARESIQVADAFLSSPFLRGQARFLWSKKKRVPATIFFSLWASRPLWFRLM